MRYGANPEGWWLSVMRSTPDAAEVATSTRTSIVTPRSRCLWGGVGGAVDQGGGSAQHGSGRGGYVGWRRRLGAGQMHCHTSTLPQAPPASAEPCPPALSPALAHT